MADVEVIHTDTMDWSPSPSAGVWRKRLELFGPVEAGRVTSVVRYDAGSAFSEHPHPDGEEILVLEGIFSDHSGDYPAGSYLLNPEGFAHAPFSEPGCTLFVKLKQYPGQGRKHVQLATEAMRWEPYVAEGIERIVLYEEEAHPEAMHLLRLGAGVTTPEVTMVGGEELFVLEGRCQDAHGAYRKGSWVRYPPGTTHRLATEEGCTLYVKKGHLVGR